MILLIDSVDHFNEDQIDEKNVQVYDGRQSGWPVIASGLGRRGTNCYEFGSNSYMVSNVLPFSGNVGVCGFAFRGAHPPSGSGGWSSLITTAHLGDSVNPTIGFMSTEVPINVICAFRNSYYTQVCLSLNQNGTLSVYVGDAAPTTGFSGFDSPPTLLGTTADALLFDVWHFIELKVLTHASAGTVELRVNGDIWLNLSGVMTVAPNGGSAGLTEFAFGQNRQASDKCRWRFDDLYVLDTASGTPTNHYTDFLGDQKWTWRPVVEDGFFNEWIPSSGASRWPMVDEAPHDGDLTYITTSGVAFRQSFKVATAAGTGQPVTAVQVIGSARRYEGGPSSTSMGLAVSGVAYPGTAKGNTSSYSFQKQIFTKRPDNLAGIVDHDINNGTLEPLVRKES